MTRAIAVVNMKGGVGKTTTAIHLAAGFARRGARVLLVDADPQGTIANTFRIAAGRSIADVMRGEPAASAIVEGVRERLDVLPSTPAAFALESQLAGAVQRETLLARAMRGVPAYDVTVFDTSPAMSLLTFNALLAARELVVTIGMEPMALIGARQTLQGVAQIRELWPDRPLDLAAVVPVGVNLTTHASRATLEAIRADAMLSPALFGRGIRQCLDLTYATAQAQTIWEYAPRSRAAEDFDALLDTLARVRDSQGPLLHAETTKTEAIL